MLADRAISGAVAAAIAEGERVRGTTSPNPPVGCVLVDAHGETIARAATHPAGGPHAEAAALDAAGERARGATAVVTLEPCNHTGRTGPCAQALVRAGVAEVVYLTGDPNPVAAGGADYLRANGVVVRHFARRVEALQPWLTSLKRGRPAVTWKYAATADGFTAAVNGTSQWITGEPARARVHEDRARRDAIIVGTGTAIADNPSLTARRPDGTLYPWQPRRVVVGTREVPAGNLTGLGFEQYPGPREALRALWETGARDVLLEGGATLSRGMLEAGLIDAVQAYVAPAFLGAGRGVLGGQVAGTIGQAVRFSTTRVEQIGEDIYIEMERQGD